MHSKRIKKKVKRDYEEIADDFSMTRRFPWKDFDLFLPYYESGFDILDLGCGNGRLLTFLEKNGYKSYLGVDQSEGLIANAKKKYPKSKFLVSDMTKLPDLRHKFDCIFLVASFHHLPPLSQLKALKSWKKLLKPDGYIFMTNWNLHQPRFWVLWIRSLIFPIYGLKGLLVPWGKQLKRYYYAFTKRRLKKLLRKAGCNVLFNDYVKNGESANLFSGSNILTIAKNENS